MEVLISKNLPVINAPKLEITGIKPFRAKPVATPKPLASAIPTSNDLFGNALKKLEVLVADFKSQLTTQIFLFFFSKTN